MVFFRKKKGESRREKKKEEIRGDSRRRGNSDYVSMVEIRKPIIDIFATKKIPCLVARILQPKNSTSLTFSVVAGWIESEAYLEPSRTSTMELFCENS